MVTRLKKHPAMLKAIDARVAALESKVEAELERASSRASTAADNKLHRSLELELAAAPTAHRLHALSSWAERTRGLSTDTRVTIERVTREGLRSCQGRRRRLGRADQRSRRARTRVREARAGRVQRGRLEGRPRLVRRARGADPARDRGSPGPGSRSAQTQAQAPRLVGRLPTPATTTSARPSARIRASTAA